MVATQAMSILAKSLALFCNFLKDQIIRECSWTDLNQRRQVCVLPIARHGYIGEGVTAYLFWTLTNGTYNFSGHWNHWNRWNRWGHWWQYFLFPFSCLLEPWWDGFCVTRHHLLFSILDLAFSSSPEGFEEGASQEVLVLAPLHDLQCYFSVPVLQVYRDVNEYPLTLIPWVIIWAMAVQEVTHCLDTRVPQFSVDAFKRA